jgi:hypothetical protein
MPQPNYIPFETRRIGVVKISLGLGA